MPRKPEWVIRVIVPESEVHNGPNRTHGFGEFLEQLRYAGIVTLHETREDKYIFDIHCPSGRETEMWASMNAERMQSFGYNAVKAPAFTRCNVKGCGVPASHSTFNKKLNVEVYLCANHEIDESGSVFEKR